MGVASSPNQVCQLLPIEDMSSVGDARRKACALAKKLGLNETHTSNLAIAVTEVCSNIVQHAQRGQMLLRQWGGAAGKEIEVLALDNGPGMANVVTCLQDGYSTGGSRGVGLGAMTRLSNDFDVFSAPDKGTVIRMLIGQQSQEPQHKTALDWGVVCVAKAGESTCGDGWSIRNQGHTSSALLVDGLGHGTLAHEATAEALRGFASHSGEKPAATLMLLDQIMQSTRGAVAAMVQIDLDKNKVNYAGVGNVSASLMSSSTRTAGMVSHNGTLGQSAPTFKDYTLSWPNQGMVIMHSDGLSESWDLNSYPGLCQKTPAIIAAVLYRDCANRRDDSVVMVGKAYQQPINWGAMNP